MAPEKTSDVKDLVSALQYYIDQLNDVLIKDVCKELRETNKRYRDLVCVASELSVRLSNNSSK